MEEQVQQKKPLKGFSIAGIIVGIIGLLFSLFAFAGPLFSWAALSAVYFGVPALILGILGLIFASKAKAKKTLSIIVIIISIAACAIGYYGFSKTASAFEDVTGDLENWAEEMENAVEDLEVE